MFSSLVLDYFFIFFIFFLKNEGKRSPNKMQMFEELHGAKSAEPPSAANTSPWKPNICLLYVRAVQLGSSCLPYELMDHKGYFSAYQA